MLQKIKNICFQKIFKSFLLVIVLFIMSVFLCNFYIFLSTKNQIYSDINKLPKNDIGLVLGSGKTLRNGHENLYFQYRIETALMLFK